MSATDEQIRLLTEYIEGALGEPDDSDEQPFGERPRVEADAINSLIVYSEDGYSAVRVTVSPHHGDSDLSAVDVIADLLHGGTCDWTPTPGEDDPVFLANKIVETLGDRLRP